MSSIILLPNDKYINYRVPLAIHVFEEIAFNMISKRNDSGQMSHMIWQGSFLNSIR